MVDEIAEFNTEHIPGEDILYMRVHKMYLAEGELIPGVFQNKPKDSGMSVDWGKYSTPQATQARAKVPLDNGVISFTAAAARSIPNQTVEHFPIFDNQSHAQVNGVKDVEVRARFMKIFQWEVLLTESA